MSRFVGQCVRGHDVAKWLPGNCDEPAIRVQCGCGKTAFCEQEGVERRDEPLPWVAEVEG